MPAPIHLSHSSKSRSSRTAILHVCPELEPCDPGRETLDLAIQTQRAGLGWRTFIASSGGRLVKESERAAVRHKKIPLTGRSAFGAWRARMTLETLIQKEQPSLVHAHGAEVLPFAYTLSRVRRLPLVIDLTQPLPDKPRLRRIMSQLNFAPCAIRVASEHIGWQLQEQFQVEPERLYHIPPGVDLKFLGAGFISPERLHSLSALWRLPEQASIMLVPMPLAHNLGHRVFLDALATMRDEPVFAVMVGHDRQAPGMRGEIEKMIAQLDLNGKVIMPEYCPDLPAACWLTNVVVAVNSEPRGLNPELLAAQAIGRPVIVSDVGANREMVLSGETAWVVPPDDVGALAAAMREAVKLSTSQCLDIAERTHNFIAGRFPHEAWLSGMIELYESMLRPARTQMKAKVA